MLHIVLLNLANPQSYSVTFRLVRANTHTEKEFVNDHLVETQRITNVVGSDIFDVLAFVTYALPTLTCNERADQIRIAQDDSRSPPRLN